MTVMVVKMKGHVYAHRLIVVFTKCELGRMLVDHIVQSSRHVCYLRITRMIVSDINDFKEELFLKALVIFVL